MVITARTWDTIKDRCPRRSTPASHHHQMSGNQNFRNYSRIHHVGMILQSIICRRNLLLFSTVTLRSILNTLVWTSLRFGTWTCSRCIYTFMMHRVPYFLPPSWYILEAPTTVGRNLVCRTDTRSRYISCREKEFKPDPFPSSTHGVQPAGLC
jgi:hypothetical protein